MNFAPATVSNAHSRVFLTVFSVTLHCSLLLLEFTKEIPKSHKEKFALALPEGTREKNKTL